MQAVDAKLVYKYMCVNAYMFVYICLYMCTHIYPYAHVYTHTHTSAHIHANTQLEEHMQGMEAKFAQAQASSARIEGVLREHILLCRTHSVTYK